MTPLPSKTKPTPWYIIKHSLWFLLLIGFASACSPQASSLHPPAEPPLEWPGAIPLPSGMELKGPIPWIIADGPFFSNTFEPILEETPSPGRVQSMQDLVLKTILLVGEPAAEAPELKGDFQVLGYHELHCANADQMRTSLATFAIDLILIQAPTPKEREQYARILIRDFPDHTFTTFQPEKGQTNLSTEVHSLLQHPARIGTEAMEGDGIRRLYQDGELIGLGPANNTLPILGIRAEVADRERRIQAFEAMLSWVACAPAEPQQPTHDR